MSYLNKKQDKTIIKILEDIIKDGKDEKAIHLINSEKLICGLKKDRFEESTREDIEIAISDSESNIKLSEDQMNELTQNVMRKYDHSNYNEYIVETAEKITK